MSQLDIIKATCVGDRRIGKTSLLVTYDNHVSTIDTLGDDSGAKSRQNEYNDTNVFVLFFSIDDKDSFQNCRSTWIEELKSFRPDIPIFLVGLKSDLRTNNTDFVTYKQGLNMSIEIGAADYHECSAINNQGLSELYQYIALIGSNKKYKRKDKNHGKIMCNIL